MKFSIFEQLACLAHIKHNTQPSQFWIKLSILITYSQYIALMLPMNGWNLWSYQDRHFRLFQIITQSQLVIPLLVDSQFDFAKISLLLSFIFFLTMLAISVVLLIFGIYDNTDARDHSSTRILIYYFLLLATSVYQMPLIFLFASQIFYGEQTLNFEYQIGLQSIINFLALVLYIIYVILAQYFLRTYTFVPFNYLSSRYNGFQLIHLILNMLLGGLYFLNMSLTVQYAQIAVLHLALVFRIIESIIYKPFIPFINQDHFILSVIAECINIIASINVFTENTYLIEDYLLITMLLVGSFAFFLAESFYKRKHIQTFEYEVSNYSCIPYTQELYFKHQILIRSPQKQEFLELYFYWKAHASHCTNYLKKKPKMNQNCIDLTPQTIFCMLSTELERIKRDIKLIDEELQLLYINYMADQINKPLLAYVEMKKYEILTNQQSFYFTITRIQMSKYLQQLILSKQRILYKSKVQQQQQETERQLSIVQIFETMKFQQQFLPEISEILREKIAFWTNQIKGFSNIYDLEKLAIQQSTNILSLIKKLQHFFNFDVFHLNDHISFQTNVLNIKLISIFYSTIMNDYYGTQICESAIVEIFNQEHTYSEDVVTNLTLVQEKAAMIMLSMVKNRGKIVNQDKRLLAKYFSFEEQEFGQIESISSLMPSFFSERHDKLLQDYLQSAKSIFFDDYKMIFSLSKERMLIPQQLKIDNNFSLLDDYVLIGCLSEIKHSSDFVLFGDDGYLIGCTRNFYDNFIQSFNQTTQQQMFTETINQINVYMLFPNILDLLNDIKYRLKNEVQNGQDNYCKISKFANLAEIIELSDNIQQIVRQLSTSHVERSFSVQKSKISATNTFDQKKTLKMSIIGDYIETVSQKQKSMSFLEQLPVYNIIIQQTMVENIKKLEAKSKISYICKVLLYFKTVGTKESKKGYFILEISDIRKSNELATNESLANNPFSQTMNSRQQQDTISSSQLFFQKEHFGENPVPIAIEHVTPYNMKVNEISDIIEKFRAKALFSINEDAQQLGMESARFSISYGPLSQRIQFISPSSKQQQLQGLIDKDFTELQLQLECEAGGNLINDIDIQEPSQVKGVSNSNDKQHRSNNLLELIKENQLHKHQDELEVSAKKSRSSNTSGTSGMSAIQVLKQFQQKTNMTISLKVILAINIFVLAIMITYLIIHLINTNENIKNIQIVLINITGPALLNRYFCKAFCSIWSLVFNSLNIIESSDYIIMQTIREIADLSEIMYPSLQTMYSTFIGIEMSGLLNLIPLDFIYQNKENVTYTYFINFISNIVDSLFQVQFYSRDNLSSLIDKNYLNNLIELRHNIKNVAQMNTQLINSIDSIYVSQQQASLEDFQSQISIEIVILSLIMLFQLYYWNQLEKYTQQIVLLVGRLQENQAQELIVRFSFIQETLGNISGKQGWKQQNFYRLTYLPLNQLGIESLKTESRIVKEYQLHFGNKNNQCLNPVIEESQKKYRKNQNVALNARINSTNTSIVKQIIIVNFWLLIFIIYLLGGYLLYDKQQQDLYPTQQLTLNFIRFTSQQDIAVSGALIAKSELLLNEKLIEMKYYTAAQMFKFLGSNSTIKIFITYSDSYYRNLTDIYHFIIASNEIQGEDETALLNLYQNNFCIMLSDIAPFCNLNNLNDKFISIYGSYSENDDNREYISTGIQGIVSRMDTLFKSSFQYEIASANYETDLTLALHQLTTKEFTNAIFEHFIDTSEGTALFMDYIVRIFQNVLVLDLNHFYTYYLGAGIPMFLIFIVFFGIWLYKTNSRLIKLRLILTNLPIEILTDFHTLSLLKRLK